MDIHTSNSCKRDYIGVVSQGMEQDGIIYFPLVQISGASWDNAEIKK